MSAKPDVSRPVVIQRHHFWNDRRWQYGMLGLTTFLVALALGWEWLAAAGLLPLLLTTLPCVAMCVLGLCAKQGSEQSCSTSETKCKEAK
jgi:hypothetical protein